MKTSINTAELAERAKRVLAKNQKPGWTMPADKLYPHQWLWDTGFVAVGLSHYDANRAAGEIESVMRAQWQNGMLPHIIFDEAVRYWTGPQFWRSQHLPGTPKVATSGFTQPPVTAIAALQVARMLKPKRRDQFLANVVPGLIRYHQWLYRERDPEGEGLITLIHPWEAGLDNSPPWAEAVANIRIPLWLRLIEHWQLERLLGIVRRDIKNVPAQERLTDDEALRCLYLATVYRRKRYDSRRILRRPELAIQDLTFNSILIAANRALAELVKTAGGLLPPDLIHSFDKSIQGLEYLWDEGSGQYFSRRLAGKQLIKLSSAATLLPLYTGAVTAERAKRLVELLQDDKTFGTRYGVPSAPLNSPYFDHDRYWQGPVWVNMNWFVIQGLLRYGYTQEAKSLWKQTKELVAGGGFSEYYSPLTGEALGADNFSWTAALFIDLAQDSRLTQ
jgi:hypothetical protein